MVPASPELVLSQLLVAPAPPIAEHARCVLIVTVATRRSLAKRSRMRKGAEQLPRQHTTPRPAGAACAGTLPGAGSW